MTHTILGAGGTVANALTLELIANNQQIRLVSRSPVNFTGENIHWQKADLLNKQETINACKGSAVIYICNGVGNKNEDWQKMWPVIMENCIDAAKNANARLIFLDNIYMYGNVVGQMTEETPYNPCTIKGEVRARISQKFIAEIKRGNIIGSTARAAGFYGTDNLNSVVDTLVLNKFAHNKKAQWIGNPKCKHNFTFIADCGKALYILGKDSKGDGEVWHIPTAQPIPGFEFIQLAAEIYNVKPRFSSLNKTMLKLVGLFNSNAASISEMYYQYQKDYDFNSSKFENNFGTMPTTFREGIKQMSESIYRKK